MSKHAACPAIDVLLQEPLSECVPEARDMKFVHASSTVEELLKVLGDNRILSVPIVQPDKQGHMEWLGFVSYINIIKFFGQVVEKETFLSSTINEVLSKCHNVSHCMCIVIDGIVCMCVVLC